MRRGREGRRGREIEIYRPTNTFNSQIYHFDLWIRAKTRGNLINVNDRLSSLSSSQSTKENSSLSSAFT